jgi:hypothetical protein
MEDKKLFVCPNCSSEDVQISIVANVLQVWIQRRKPTRKENFMLLTDKLKQPNWDYHLTDNLVYLECHECGYLWEEDCNLKEYLI